MQSRHSDLVLELPTRYATSRLDQYDPKTPTQRQALAYARAMVDWIMPIADDPEPMDGLALLGPVGTGKSTLAAAICREIDVRAGERLEARKAAYQRAAEDLEARVIAWRKDPVGPHPMADPPPHWSDGRPSVPKWVNVPALVTDLRAEMNLGWDEQDETRHARRLRTWRGLVVLDDLGRERMSEWTGELLYTIVNDRYESELPTVITSNLTPDELVASGYWPAISRMSDGGKIVQIQGPDHRLTQAARIG